MPQRFRKKPVVIDAMQFDGTGANAYSICQWAINNGVEVTFNAATLKLSIPTLEGVMQASQNDWIVKGPKGEFYPVKPDIFEMTYEPA